MTLSHSRIAAIALVGFASVWACNEPGTPSTLTPPSQTGAPTAPLDPNTGLAFGPAIVIGTEQTQFHGGEPSLQVGSSGTVWSTNIGPPQVWKSSDRGSTWTFVAPPLTLGGGDMDAAEDDGGRLHVVDLTDGSVASLGCVFYYRSSDGGRSFDVVRATRGGGVWVDGDGGCATAKNGRVDRPWVATFGDRTVYIVYRDATSGSRNGGGSVDISADGGITFTHASIGDPLPQPDGMAVDPSDGTLYVVGTDAGAFDARLDRSVGRAVRVTTFRDGQQASSTTPIDSPRIDTRASGFASLAVDAAHDVYVAWTDNSAGTFDVYVSASRDHGATWSAPTRVSRNQTVAAYPTIVAGAAGRVGVAWYGTSDPATARYDAAGATWFVYAAQSINALEATPSYSIVKVSDEPFHHNSICRSVSICEGAPTTTLPHGYEAGIADFFRMALDNTGALTVIWTDTAHAGGSKDRVARQIAGPLLKTSGLTPALTQKIDEINRFAARPVSRSQSTLITENELNTYVRQWSRPLASTIDPTVTLTGPNRLTLRGLLDRRAPASDGLALWMAAGLVPVTINGVLTTQQGTATFTTESARAGERPVEDAELIRLLDTMVDPAKLGFSLSSPFSLPARIRDLHIEPGRLTIIQ